MMVFERDRERPIVIRRSSPVSLDADQVSHPQSLVFPTGDGASAYGFFYPPTHPDCAGLEEEKPPLIVMGHGGPTGAASPVLWGRRPHPARGRCIFAAGRFARAGFLPR